MSIKDTCYIYAIRHNRTKRVYIGCSSNSTRLRKHMSDLKAGRHHNKAMQEDCDKHGLNLTVYLLEILQKRDHKWVDLHEREAYWIHYYCTDDPEKGYNTPNWYTRVDITKFPKIKDFDELQIQLDSDGEREL